MPPQVIVTDLNLKYSELKVGDTVDLGEDLTWNLAIVKKIADGSVTFFRPYATTAEFEYTGGVICYLGTEEFSVNQDKSGTVRVVERRNLK